jgi:hypothetical protein
MICCHYTATVPVSPGNSLRADSMPFRGGRLNRLFPNKRRPFGLSQSALFQASIELALQVLTVGFRLSARRAA